MEEDKATIKRVNEGTFHLHGIPGDGTFEKYFLIFLKEGAWKMYFQDWMSGSKVLVATRQADTEEPPTDGWVLDQNEGTQHALDKGVGFLKIAVKE